MSKPTKLKWSLWILGAIHLLAVFGGFAAPYSYDVQDRLHPYTAPTRLHFFDCDGHLHLRPFVYALKDNGSSLDQYTEDCSRRFPLRLFVRGDEYLLLGSFQSTLHLFGVEPPARVALLGTDGFGRDQFSRLLYGGQVSLFAGFLAATFSALLGLLLGSVAGLYGGVVDDLTMRVAEIFIAMPWFYLLIAARAFLPLQISPLMAFFLVVIVTGTMYWGRPARLVRGVVLSARERNFVLAAKGFGGSRSYLLRRHLMPLTFNVLLTQMTVLVPLFIMAEVVLSFLGLGVGEPYPSWGNMLGYAQQYHVLVAYWWMLLPGLAPIPVFLAYQSLADALQERLKSNF